MAFELIPGAQISSSALTAERSRMEVVANNLANVNSTSKDGNVYKKQIPVFEAVFNDEARGLSASSELGGVKLASIESDTRDALQVYAPYHPHADQNGMVATPNMSPIEEMMDMITASRAYEANLTAFRQARDMADKMINLGKQG